VAEVALEQHLAEEVRLVAVLVEVVQETIQEQALLALQIQAVAVAEQAGTVEVQIQALQVVLALLSLPTLALSVVQVVLLHHRVATPSIHLTVVVVLRLNLRRNHGPFCKSSRRLGYSGNRCRKRVF
jgi:hypothetical protein